ncbi:MAG: DsbA family protein [Azoarcus sp.]|nr:DsbA family protein [Azoarcus sp.]
MVWGEQLKNLARLHYALLIMKRLDLHEKVFVAVQEEREPLDKVDAVREWVKANGLDVSAFMGVYNSPALGPKVQRAIHLVSLYKIDSVPKLAVGGRFMTSAEMAGNDHEAALKIVDLLIERVRKGG